MFSLNSVTLQPQFASVVLKFVPAEDSNNYYFSISRVKRNSSLLHGIGIFYLL